MTPLLATLWGLSVAIVLSVVLGRLFGAEGVAASIACGAWSSALSLVRRGAASFGFSIDQAARRRLPRIVLAALGMGGLLWLTAGLALPPNAGAHGLAQAVGLMMLISGASAVYGLLLALFGVTNWDEAVNAVRQTAASDLRD
jgi:putative peptidoglycan lipid II flippase